MTKTKTKELEKDEIKKMPDVHSNEGLNLMQRLCNFHDEEIQILKSKAAYGYKYADLENILSVIRPYLKKHGLGVRHNVLEHVYNNNITGEQSIRDKVITVVFNFDNPDDKLISSTIIDDGVSLAKMNKFMVIGSAITYFRRYHIVTMLGLTTDEDSDAGGKPMEVKTQKNGNTPNPKPSTPTSNGRSVESKQSSDETDYVVLFKNLIARDKTKVQLEGMVKNYKKNMSDYAFNEISQLIIEKFGS